MWGVGTSPSGFLQKLGDKNLFVSYKTRYFCLDKGILSYYIKSSMAQKKGSIDLKDVRTIQFGKRKGKIVLEVTTPSRIYTLLSDDPETIAQWSARLNHEIQSTETKDNTKTTEANAETETNLPCPFNPAKAVASIDALGHLSKIFIVAAGGGYSEKPVIYVTGGGSNVQPAKCVACVDGRGAILSVQIVEPGNGYTSSPTIRITNEAQNIEDEEEGKDENKDKDMNLSGDPNGTEAKTPTEQSSSTKLLLVSYDVLHYVPTQVEMDRLPSVFAQYQNKHGLMAMDDSVCALALGAAGIQNTTGETFQKLIGCVNRVGFLNEKEFVAMVYSAWMLGMGPNPLGSDDGGDGERKGEAEAEGEGEKKSSIGSKDDQTTVATTTTTTTTTTSKEETNATSDQDNAATASDATTATYHNQNKTFDKIFHTYSLGTRFIDISNSSQFPSRNIESVMADLLGKLRTKPTLTADLLPAKLTTMSLRSQNRGISKLELAIFVNALNQVKREPWDEHINNCDQVVLWKFQLTSVQLYQTLLLNTFDERIASVAAPLTMPVTVAATSKAMALYSGLQQGHSACNPEINHMAKSYEMLHHLKTLPNFASCLSNEDQISTNELNLLMAIVELEHSNFCHVEKSFLKHPTTMEYLNSILMVSKKYFPVGSAGRCQWSKVFSNQQMSALIENICQRNRLLWLCLLNPSCNSIWTGKAHDKAHVFLDDELPFFGLGKVLGPLTSKHPNQVLKDYTFMSTWPADPNVIHQSINNDTNDETTKVGGRLLMVYAKVGNTNGILELKQKCSVNVLFSFVKHSELVQGVALTPLYVALDNNHMDFALYLINMGADTKDTSCLDLCVKKETMRKEKSQPIDPAFDLVSNVLKNGGLTLHVDSRLIELKRLNENIERDTKDVKEVRSATVIFLFCLCAFLLCVLC